MTINIPWLNEETLEFPPVESALDEPNGLLAAGGDLSPQRLLAAYRNGIFPWYEADQPILWWCPKPRTIFNLDEINISRSLKKNIRHGGFSLSFDTNFAEVITNCSLPRPYSEDTWITEEMISAYIALHHLGHAHSAECWLDGKLVGGLYGICIGKVFFGESMFSLVPNASKVALALTQLQLSAWGFPIIDCQLKNDHLSSLGAIEIPFKQFQEYLDYYCEEQAPTSPWLFDSTILDQI